jgi:hypothetical protein
MIILRGVNVFPTQIEELILKRPELSAHYQCVLTREGPMDNLIVVVETRPGLSPESIEARAAAKMLQHEIKAYIGTSVDIELRAEGGGETQCFSVAVEHGHGYPEKSGIIEAVNDGCRKLVDRTRRRRCEQQ